MLLDQWGAIAAILTFLGGAGVGVAHIVSGWIYRRRIVMFLVKRRKDAQQPPRRFVGEIAVEVGLSLEDAYHLAVKSKLLERGSYSPKMETTWFSATDRALKLYGDKV